MCSLDLQNAGRRTRYTSRRNINIHALRITLSDIGTRLNVTARATRPTAIALTAAPTICAHTHDRTPRRDHDD